MQQNQYLIGARSTQGMSEALTVDGEFLHSAPFSSAAVRRQAEAADAAACADAGAQHIFRVQIVSTLTQDDNVQPWFNIC